MENKKLYIVATPIGNLADITLRAIKVLKDVDCIYAEDTRVTSKLLKHFEIDKPLKRCDENVIRNVAPIIITQIQSGANVAFCTDAGMPCISDPGSVLVDEALNAGVSVEVIPGPSALSCAIAASGFLSEKLFFVGFMERKKVSQLAQLLDLRNRLSGLHTSIILYESPKRLLATLKNILQIFGDTQIAVCRELTKIHEEIVRGVAQEVYDNFAQRDEVKGEIVIVIDYNIFESQNTNKQIKGINQILREIIKDLDLGVAKKEIALKIADSSRFSKNDIYDAILLIDKFYKEK